MEGNRKYNSGRGGTMKERPILFNGEMVNAILDGRKTQTRRVTKCKGPHGVVVGDNWPLWEDEYGDWHPEKCPYGQPDDQLWVRETFMVETNLGYQDVYDVPSCPLGPVKWNKDDEWTDGHYFECPRYRASEPDIMLVDIDGAPCRWKPSIHMPRWASRIDLRITNIRVERVQDISEKDARAEGVSDPGKYLGYYDGSMVLDCDPDEENEKTYRGGFAFLWDSINIRRGFGWEVNPWVWVVEFERIA
jgi:hypothetical protein